MRALSRNHPAGQEKQQKMLYSTLVKTNKQLVTKIHELSIVRRINDSLRFVPDMKKVCCSILDTLRDEMDVKYCSIMLLDNEKECLVLKALWSPEEKKTIFYEQDSPHYQFRLDEGVAGKAAKEGIPILINDVTIDQRFVSIRNRRNNIKSLLCMPLRAGEETVGVLNLSHNDPNAFSKAEKNLLNMITNQVAIALKNVHLFKEMQEINRTLEKKVQERTKKLEALNKTLIKTRDQLIHSEKMAAIGTLAGGVAHEFNNLLCMIQGYAELALQKSDEKMSYKALGVIMNASERAKTISKNLLSFSKRTESRRELANIINAMEETLTLIERDIEKDNITIIRNYTKVPEFVFDVSLIQQVFLNLIINGRHAMKGKKGKLYVSIFPQGRYAVIEIADTGHGIKKELQKKIFEPFFTTKGVWGSDDVPGTGLGLSVSLGVVESHNGTLEVVSEYNKGALFRIKLPRVNKTSKSTRARENTKNKNGCVKRANILVVDDEDSIRELLNEMLSMGGHKVKTVSSGKEAIQICKKEMFDVVFMDIMMPGINGVESVKQIQLSNGKPKFVFVTGLNFDKNNGNKFDLRGHEFIKKPFKLNEINQVLEKLLTLPACI